MKKIVHIILMGILLSCDSERVNDCFQATGTIISEEFTVQNFTKIRIEDDVNLIIKQHDDQKVRIRTGENLLSDVSVSVEEGVLVIRNNNSCNLVCDYSNVTAVVQTPNITEIRNSSSGDITGDGTLEFPILYLVSNTSINVEGVRKSGDFTMKVKCERFFVTANGYSRFYISGTSEKATISLEDEVPLFVGPGLISDEIIVFQRSAASMVVNPQNSIRGSIRGTGNVICKNRPPLIDVNEYYTGRLIFED